MPEVNGYEVLELLRTSEIGNSQTIPVVAATAAGYVEEEELKRKGFAAVLYKPYSIGELLAVTENSIKRNDTNRIDLSPLLAFGDKRRTLEKLAERYKPHRPLAPACFRRETAHVGKAGDHYAIRHGGSAQGGGSKGHRSVGRLGTSFEKLVDADKGGTAAESAV